jgi:Concanavalin A-like lectin/glucanases superfamily
MKAQNAKTACFMEKMNVVGCFLLAAVMATLIVGFAGTAFAWESEYTSDSNTMGLWHFNETSGDTAYNSVTGGNDAAVQVPYRGWKNEYTADTYTIGLWHFNETSGDTAYNSVSGNDGTLHIPYREWQSELSVDTYTVGLWHFNETSGDTAYNSYTDGNDGALNGDTIGWTTGKFGNGLDISDQNSDYVAIDNYDTIDMSDGSVTWEFWMKPDVLDEDLGWGSPVNPYGKVEFLYSQIPAGGVMKFKIYDWPSSQIITSADTLTPGEWAHIAGTWNDTTKVQSLYINGVLAVSNTFTDYDCAGYSMWCGSARNLPNTYNFAGVIDDLRVSNVDRFSLENTADSDMWTSGKFGNAVKLNDQDGDYIAIDNYDTIDMSDGSVTWEFWMKPDVLDEDLGWGSPVNPYGKVEFLYRQIPAGGVMKFKIYDWPSSQTITSADTLTPGKWAHIAGTWNDTTKVQSLYINGVLAVSGTFTDYDCASYSMWCGSARNLPNTYNFAGVIDELHVSNIDRYNVYNEEAWTTGKFGNTVDLRGTDDAYLTIENYDDINIHNTSMTWEFWMKPDQLEDTGVDRGYPVAAYGKAEFRYEQSTTGGTVAFLMYDWSKVGTDEPYYSFLVSEDTLTPDTWTHIAGVWNRDNQTQKLYINGVLNVTSYTLSKAYCAGYGMGIGKPLGTPYRFSGLVDEIRISNVDRFDTTTSPDTTTTYVTVNTTDDLEDSIMYATDNTVITLSSGTHHIESFIPIAGVKNLTIQGQGWDTTTCEVTSGVSTAFKIMSGVEDLVIEKMTIRGGDTNTSNIHAIGSSGTTIHTNNVTFRYLWIENIGVGISVGGGVDGEYDTVTITDNVIYKTIGNDPGWGYGIHNNNAHNVTIANNWIEEATRHSIYQARGDTNANVLIKNNFILNHDYYDSDSRWYLCAVAISRSSDVRVANNIIVNPHSGAIALNPDVTYDWPATNIVLLNNQILGGHSWGIWDETGETNTALGNIMSLENGSDFEYNFNDDQPPYAYQGSVLVSPDDRWDSTISLIAEMDDSIYVIQDNTLDEITPYTWSYTTDTSTTWSGVNAITALENAVGGNGRLYIVKDEELHEVDPASSFADNPDTETVWDGVRFMAAADGYVIIADTDTLWKVVPSTLNISDSSMDWADINLMCDWGTYAYVDYGDTHYEVNTSTLDATVIGVTSP